MASEIKVDTIVNAGGDNDTGIDLATNDQILLKVANATKLTMNSTGQTTIVGEGGTTTTSLQQGLCKVWCHFTGSGTPSIDDSFNSASITDRGTGTHTLNFSNNFGNANYAGQVLTGNDTATSVARSRNVDDTPTTSAFAVRNMSCLDPATTTVDDANNLYTLHGDLA